MNLAIKKISILLPVAVLATACQRGEKAAPPSVIQVKTPVAAPQEVAGAPAAPVDPEEIRMMELMHVIYGTAANTPLIVDLPDYDKRSEKSSYRITPLSMHGIGTDRVALVASANYAHDDNPSHGQPGLLNAYVLQKQDGKWKVERRFENVDAMGTWGKLGTVAWVELGPGQPGFVIEWGGTWQGNTVQYMSVFDLGDPKLHDLAKKVGLVGSDNGGDCDERRHRCWSVEGKWRFERKTQQPYDDLVFDFSGYTESRPEDSAETVARTRTEVSNTARYAFRSGEYVLASGEHSVPNP
ncbi:hypothetical protein [Pseudoduganella violaceinigra]|uniref:hypothetical protein n=1 Tax=Pseudoduganella violaceinigra TaxID=246602 RepID=UPI0012B5B9EC|nr:hypothetical protein [Pseudoduganella violaceinigra]